MRKQTGKRKTTNERKQRNEYENHTCGECGHAIENVEHINKSLNGEFFCVDCPYSEWVRLKREQACRHFINGRSNERQEV